MLVCQAAREASHYLAGDNGRRVAALSPAQVAMLLKGIHWRAPIRTERPQLAG
jgi:hypothetical protein